MSRITFGKRLKRLLMLPPQLISAFLNQASAQGSKSTVLKPLGWFLSILAAAVLTGVELKAPNWLLIVFTVGICVGASLYLVAYMFCLFKDRDALRSEKYSIQKLAIQKGFLGDSLTGTFSADDETALTTAMAAGTPVQKDVQ